MRQGYRDARQVLCQKFADAKLVVGIDDRPQQANGDRLDLQFPQPEEELDQRGFIEGLYCVTFRIDALRQFEGECARHIGFGIGYSEVERLDSPTLADHKNVAVSLCREQCRAGNGSGEDGVDCASSAMHQCVGAAEKFAPWHTEIGGCERQPVENP
jgi:hypothetical protein